MSCSYDLACADCADTTAGFDFNHAGEGLAELLQIRPTLEALGGWLANPNATANQWRIDGTGMEVGVYGKAARFLASHVGHDVYVRDEYGRRYDECSKRIDCSGCGSCHYCKLPVGHDGECKRVRA